MSKMTSILLLALGLRLFGLNWDQGLHLHPDERMLLMVADKVSFFSNLNPDFFNYGSLPIYILKGLSQLFGIFFVGLATYQDMIYVGRILSTFADLGTIFLIYKITQLLFKKESISLMASFFYAIAFFPIQNSHFFIVDTFLTFFATLLIYLVLSYWERPEIQKIIGISAALAAAVTTKFTAVIFAPFVFFALIIRNFKQLKNLAFSLSFFSILFFLFSFLFMPYAYLNYQKFLSDIAFQLKLNNDPYVFPYTLQYVGSIPYLYYLKNIFLWGLGPIISILSLIGLLQVVSSVIARSGTTKQSDERIASLSFAMTWVFLLFYLLYFLIVGKSAVKFMRYILPIYPFFAVMASYAFFKFFQNKRVMLAVLVFASLWTLLFLNIYTKPHTRIAATDWIVKNIPKGSTIAVEHWDDHLPLYDENRYAIVELTLYDQPDNLKKWDQINQKLGLSDYIIIASNRLYVPIQKLKDCNKYKVCYPLASGYYYNLFHGKPILISSGPTTFKKVAEFSAYPGIGPFKINDQMADESFTVYDHPKIMIFKKM